LVFWVQRIGDVPISELEDVVWVDGKAGPGV
jgi:hypothetical protein